MPDSEILLIGVLNPKLLNNLLASCFFINLDLLLHTALFDKSITLPLPVIVTLGCLLSVFFLHFKQNNEFFFINNFKIVKTRVNSIGIKTGFPSILTPLLFVNFGPSMQKRFNSSYYLFDQICLYIIWITTPRIFVSLFDCFFDYWYHYMILK